MNIQIKTPRVVASVSFDVSGAPDLEVEYSRNAAMFRPASGLAELRFDGSSWGVESITVRGLRLLKDGRTGQMGTRRSYGGYRGEVPEWLQPVADAALAAVEAEL